MYDIVSPKPFLGYISLRSHTPKLVHIKKNPVDVIPAKVPLKTFESGEAFE
jgi:hypothetical protein